MEEVATGRSTLSDRVHEAWVANADALWRSVRAWSADPDIASDAVAEAFAQALRRGEVIDDVGRWTGRAAFRIAAGMLQARRLAGSELTGDPPGGDWLPEDTWRCSRLSGALPMRTGWWRCWPWWGVGRPRTSPRSLIRPPVRCGCGFTEPASACEPCWRMKMVDQIERGLDELRRTPVPVTWADVERRAGAIRADG